MKSWLLPHSPREFQDAHSGSLSRQRNGDPGCAAASDAIKRAAQPRDSVIVMVTSDVPRNCATCPDYGGGQPADRRGRGQRRAGRRAQAQGREVGAFEVSLSTLLIDA